MSSQTLAKNRRPWSALRRLVGFGALLAAGSCAARAPVPEARLVLVDLRCEGRVEPLGIGAPRPRLSWRVAPGTGKGTSAWQVQAAATSAALADGQADLWDSGRVTEGDACAARFAPALAARAEVHWRARAWDEVGRVSAWSAPARFTLGLLTEEDWHGSWIGAHDAATAARTDSPWLRTTLVLPAGARRLVAHVASLGYQEPWLNGAKVGADVLMPSVVDLSRRARAVTYETSANLQAGENVIGLWLASGWAANERYGVEAHPLARVELEVELADGRRLRAASGPEWEWRASSRQHLGPWAFGSYGGERVVAELENADWCRPGGAVGDWRAVASFPCALPIVSEACEATRPVEELRPASIEEQRPGVWRVDFGRAFTGFTRIALVGAPGATVHLSWSEREDEECTYGQASELVLDGAGRGVFEHRFNYAAARWLTLEGAARAPRLDEVTGLLVRTGYARTARFRCSDPTLQAVHDAVAWTYECLSLGGYTVDCAHRERWGYGGDAHATMETALDHFDVGPLYAKWLDDWAAIQNEHGNLPFTCPTYQGGGGPAWSGIVVMLPWELWLRTGDERVLARAWPVIERWLEFLESQTVDGVLEFYFDARYTADVYSFLGDWVPPGGVQAGGPPGAEARFFNNAYRVWNVRTAARIAARLGREEDARQLAQRADELAAAVHARFFDPARRVYVSERQTYLALPLLAGLGDTGLREELFLRLVADLETRRHVDTGIHGTWMLTRLLLERGRADLCALVASQRDFPSWGDMLAQGATTIWEQWDGDNSRMHSSFLSIGAFFVEGLAGIRADPEAPGYAHVVLAPCFAPGLSEVECELDTPRGTVRSAWRREGDVVQYSCTIPPLSRATLTLPRSARLAAGTHVLTLGPGSHEIRFLTGPLTFRGDEHPESRSQSRGWPGNAVHEGGCTWTIKAVSCGSSCPLRPMRPEKSFAVAQRQTNPPNSTVETQFWEGAGSIAPGRCRCLEDRLRSCSSETYKRVPRALATLRPPSLASFCHARPPRSNYRPAAGPPRVCNSRARGARRGTSARAEGPGR